MDKQKYFDKSKEAKLPNRCPILDRCARRAWTIYFFSGLHKEDRNNNMVECLQKEGLLKEDFQKDSIGLRGEAPAYNSSYLYIAYENMCPEVNLFDTDHGLRFAKGTASSNGEWDDLKENNKFTNFECKHFSECPEFSFFAYRHEKSKNKRRAISKILRFEIFHRDNFTCQYCKRTKDDPGVKLVIDHIVPVAEGGTDEFSNLITACEDCNQGKSNKII